MADYTAAIEARFSYVHLVFRDSVHVHRTTMPCACGGDMLQDRGSTSLLTGVSDALEKTQASTSRV